MSSCACWSIMVSAVVSWQTSRGLLVNINIQLSVITLESQRAVSWTFTDMAVSDIITFLNYYNSPGKAKAHLDKVSVLRLHLYCACIYVGQSWCPVELSLDCPNTDSPTWSLEQSLHPPLFGVYEWLVSDHSVSPIQEKVGVNTELRRSSPASALGCRAVV